MFPHKRLCQILKKRERRKSYSDCHKCYQQQGKSFSQRTASGIGDDGYVNFRFVYRSRTINIFLEIFYSVDIATEK